MTNQEVIEELRKHGYRVRITHYRYLRAPIRGVGIGPFKVTSIHDLGMGKYILPRGGITLVDISRLKPFDRHIMVGSARCQLTDAFVYSEGTRLGLLDALPSEDQGQDDAIPREKARIAAMTFTPSGEFVSCVLTEE